MAKVTDIGGRPHSGQMSNVVVAIVVDNVDPDELARIKVKYPTLEGEPESAWVRQVAPMGGIERGFYALPEVDDEVLVAFLQGSHDVGVIIGQFWNGQDKPPLEAKDGLPGPGATGTGASWSTDEFSAGTTDLEKNDRRFWKSRSGHLFVFDDSDGAETVQIWDKKHELALVFDCADSRIILSNSAGDLHIRTKNDLYLEAGNNIKWRAGNNIEGESGVDTTHKAGANWKTEAGTSVSHTSGTSYTIEGGTTFSATAKTSATVEGKMSFTGKGGASAKLEGGALAEVKGGMVKIN